MWKRVLDFIFGPESDGEEVFIDLRPRTRLDDYHDAWWKLRRELGREPTPYEVYDEVL